MSLPPRVAYSSSKSLRDILVRSKLPPSSYRQDRRLARVGFKKCGKSCSACSHSQNSTTHTCNFTGESFTISSNITCTTPNVIYTVGCTKDTGECARLKGPQYVGCTSRSGNVRLSEHVGSVMQLCQANTRKTVGVHFRSPGHTHSNMKFLPIEKVRCSDMFVLEAREDFWIKKYEAVKSGEVDIIEHGLNLK